MSFVEAVESYQTSLETTTFVPPTSTWFAMLFPIAASVTREMLINAVIFLILLGIVFEIIFAFIIIGYVVPRLQRFRKPVATEIPPLQFFGKIFDVVDALPQYSIREYLSGFFHNASLEDVYEENLASFIAWGIIGKRMHELDAEEEIKVRELLRYAAGRYEAIRNLKPGFNPNISHVAFTLEPVRYVHRPLFLYILTGVQEFLFNTFYLRTHGFHFLETEDMTYWIKEGKSSLPPLLICHGISTGWSMYALLIHSFTSDRTIILADLDAVKILSMCFYMPSRAQYTQAVLRILQRHRIPQVSIVGHSFGSITAAWLVAKHPEVVAHVTLIDPVSILLCLPEVVGRFVYRNLTQCRSVFEVILWFFASREITVSYALHRNFVWHNNVCWLHELPPQIGAVVAVATHDEISNAEMQSAYVQTCIAQREHQQQSSPSTPVAKISSVVWPGYSHGQILLSPAAMQALQQTTFASEKHCASLQPLPASSSS